jgi:Zn-dependent peptidase ImmA (M78 family)/DNA-binding XRE family transcriptional regulator
MAKPIHVKVNPKVFKWLRESSGWTIEEVAKRLRTTAGVVIEIEEGRRNPTLRQLRELASAFKVPLAAFLLPEPKKEKWPKDYRMIPRREGVFDKKTIIAIRRARSLQEAARELFENIGENPEPKITRAQIKDDPETLAKEYRKIFGLSVEKQIEFNSAHAMFNHLRSQLEDLNVLVFQFPMPIEDARGFALTDEYPAVIVVNSKDIIEARLFTLMHEFAHILLGESVIDKPSILFPAPIYVEKWCNEFASSFLLPREQATREFSAYISSLTDIKTLKKMSNKFKVSRQMLLYNMSKYGYISKKIYDKIINSYRQQEAMREDKVDDEAGEGGWCPPPDKRIMLELGGRFISIVVENYHQEAITYPEALDFLSTKTKTFEKLLLQVGRQ